MGLDDDVQAGIVTAMKAHDTVRLAALRMLKTALTNKAVEKGRPLDDAEAVQVVASNIKQRRDSIEQFARAGRQDLVDREVAEIEVLASFQPPPVDATELERVVASCIADVGAASPRDLGRVMKAAMAKLTGRTVDGRQVSELARRLLGG
ncbi:MAG: GatB/YqeY domain-containing protein [Acidobacteriota bacterium]